MTDPARLLSTEIDGRSRRAMQAAISDEPPPGAKAELWRSITLALPAAGVLAGATTVASGVKAATLASSATAAAGTSVAASGATAVGSATVVGTSVAAAGTVAAVGASGLGVIAAKAVAVGLGIGLAVNVASTVATQVVDSKPAAPAVAPVSAPRAREALPVNRAKPLPVTSPNVAVTTAPAEATVPSAATAAAARLLVSEPATSDELREESALLVRTREALNASDGARALELIRESRERFVGARLAQERDALEVQALVMAGETAQATARARTFLARYPESPHAEKIRAIVGLH